MKRFLINFFYSFTHNILKVRWKDLQTKTLSFCINCYGIENTFSKRERALRFGEEAIELLQTTGLTKEDIINLIEYVYRKNPGEVKDEFAGAQLTLLALANSFGVYLDDEADNNLELVNKNMPMIIKKYCKKPDQIVCVYPLQSLREIEFD